MKKLSWIIRLSLGLCLLAGPALAGGRLVRLSGVSLEALTELQATGIYDVLEYRDGEVVAVEDRQLAASSFRVFGESSVELMADIDDAFAAFREKGSEGAYHSDAEVRAELAERVAAHPERAELVEIGRSIEDRPIQAIRIGKRDGVPRPVGLFVSMIHAREWITTELGMALVQELLETEDAALREVLDNVEVWVVPVLNPDGLIWSQSQYKWWRGNRRPLGNNRFGVDLNRNFPAGWGIGSSSIPGSQTYKGAEPLSEPEAKALDDLVAAKKPVVTMTIHAYGEMILRPYGYRTQVPAREDLFSAHGTAMKNATGYRTGPVSQLIGKVGGATDDQFLEAYGAFPMSLELANSFIPDEVEIPGIVTQSLPAPLLWVKAIPALAGIDPRLPATAPEVRFTSLHVGR